MEKLQPCEQIHRAIPGAYLSHDLAKSSRLPLISPPFFFSFLPSILRVVNRLILIPALGAEAILVHRDQVVAFETWPTRAGDDFRPIAPR